jgi:hypothetical protein
MASSGMLRRVALVRTDVSEEHSASIRVTRIGELGTTLSLATDARCEEIPSRFLQEPHGVTSQKTPFFIPQQILCWLKWGQTMHDTKAQLLIGPGNTTALLGCTISCHKCMIYQSFSLTCCLWMPRNMIHVLLTTPLITNSTLIKTEGNTLTVSRNNNSYPEIFYKLSQ